MISHITVLHADDDLDCLNDVRKYFSDINAKELYGVEFDLISVDSVDKAVKEIRRKDSIHVAIVDMEFEDSTRNMVGFNLIDKIHKYDGKIIFIIFSKYRETEPEINQRLRQQGLPYLHSYYVHKGGYRPTQVALKDLFDKVAEIAKSYVPYYEPMMVEVHEYNRILDEYTKQEKTFKDNRVRDSMSFSQETLTKLSIFASRVGAGPGLETSRICALAVGSFARLEAVQPSDLDYFVVYDDEKLPSGLDAADFVNIAVYDNMFRRIGAWADANINKGACHGYDSDNRKPGVIRYNQVTLPSWSPLSEFFDSHRNLGFDSQLELSKMWFLLEAVPIFNVQRFYSIRDRIASECFGIDLDQESCIAVESEILPTRLTELRNWIFESIWKSDEPSTLQSVKYHFMRSCHIASCKLHMLRHHIDPECQDISAREALIGKLSDPPVIKLLAFRKFIKNKERCSFSGRAKIDRILTNIINHYSRILNKLANERLREVACGKLPEEAGSRMSALQNLQKLKEDCSKIDNSFTTMFSLIAKEPSIDLSPKSLYSW